MGQYLYCQGPPNLFRLINEHILILPPHSNGLAAYERKGLSPHEDPVLQVDMLLFFCMIGCRHDDL